MLHFCLSTITKIQKQLYSAVTLYLERMNNQQPNAEATSLLIPRATMVFERERGENSVFLLHWMLVVVSSSPIYMYIYSTYLPYLSISTISNYFYKIKYTSWILSSNQSKHYLNNFNFLYF